MIDLKIGVVGIPGKWSTETLADAVEKRTGFRSVIDMADVCLHLKDQRLLANDLDLCELDGLLIKKISSEYSPQTLDRLELLRVAEQRGVKVFSGVENILRLINRMSCTITLNRADIPMPPTVITENIESAFSAIKNYGSAVLKPLFSTKARGMCLLQSDSDDSELRRDIENFKAKNPMMYIQKKLNLPGRDLGLVFLGGRYLGAYARVSKTDAWNTTIHSGGKYEPVELSQEIIELGRKAQAPFNMDFTTVDIAETDSGPVVFEVSAFGGFRGALEGAGLDAASAYVDYAIAKLQQGGLEG